MRVTALGLGQESGVVLGGGIVVDLNVVCVSDGGRAGWTATDGAVCVRAFLPERHILCTALELVATLRRDLDSRLLHPHYPWYLA